jgi:hypothetical protein
MQFLARCEFKSLQKTFHFWDILHFKNDYSLKIEENYGQKFFIHKLYTNLENNISSPVMSEKASVDSL